MNKLTKIILLLSLLTFSCSSSELSNKQTEHKIEKVNIKKLAKSKYGSNYLLISNSPKDFLLCISNKKSKIQNSEATKYFIFDIINNSIIAEEIITSGNISWHSDYEIKIVEIPGIIQKNQIKEYGFILNVKTKLKTKIDGRTN